MRHFGYLSQVNRGRYFEHQPEPIDPDGPAEDLAVALGATLYTPATREGLDHVVVRQAERGATSMVLCLEDAVPDDLLDKAWGLTASSRLSCQVKLAQADLVVEIPPYTINHAREDH